MKILQLYFLEKKSPKITSMMILNGIEYLQDGDLSTKKKPGEVGVFLETAHPAKFKEKVDSILDSDIEIPARLAEFMKGEKKSIQMTKDFASFKNYLMNE
jgi:threonine synthase